MVNQYSVIYLLFAHLICDFITQPRKVALGKSDNPVILMVHVLMYSSLMMMMLIPFYNPLYASIFTLANCILHFIVDYYTSRAGAYLHKMMGVDPWFDRLFWWNIGFDQFLHGMCLVSTMRLLN